jgi:hypothetical protein
MSYEEVKLNSKAKSFWFASNKNKIYLSKQINSRYVNEGGKDLSLKDIESLIVINQAKWPHTQHLDSYESLVYDPVTEQDKIYQDFSKWIWPTIVPDEMDAIKKPLDNTNWGVEEWRNMDVPRENLDKNVDQETYRYDNNIPLYQIQPDRHYDRDHNGSGYTGRSLNNPTHGIWNMDEAYAIANKPYDKNDTNDFPYYGQPSDTSNTLLITTAWNSGGSKASSLGI